MSKILNLRLILSTSVFRVTKKKQTAMIGFIEICSFSDELVIYIYIYMAINKAEQLLIGLDFN